MAPCDLRTVAGGAMTKPAENVVDFEERRSAEEAAKDLVPVFSEDRIALEFVDRNIDYVRFDDRSCRWHTWTGTRWRPDTSDVVFSWVRSLTRAMVADQSTADRR